MRLKWLHSLYHWTMGLAGSKHAEKALFGVSFAESSFFPIPPDLMLIPMVVARLDRAWWLALVCTVGSVLGGVAGYAIGALLWGTVGEAIIGFYGVEHKMETLAGWYAAYGAWIVLLAGFTPIPYKVFTIASGVFGFAFWPFVMLSLISRGARFFLVAALLKLGGPSLRTFVEQRLEIMTVLAAIVLVGGFVLLKVVL